MKIGETCSFIVIRVVVTFPQLGVNALLSLAEEDHLEDVEEKEVGKEEDQFPHDVLSAILLHLEASLAVLAEEGDCSPDGAEDSEEEVEAGDVPEAHQVHPNDDNHEHHRGSDPLNDVVNSEEEQRRVENG